MAGPVNHNDIGELLAGVREAVKSGKLTADAPLLLPAEARVDLPVLRLERRVDASPQGIDYTPEPEIPPSRDAAMGQDAIALETATARLEDAVLRQEAEDWERDGGDAGVSLPPPPQSRVALPRLDVLRAQVRSRRDAQPAQDPVSIEQDSQLREMVSGLVRAELRGAVGVDISERLREMVRDEIRTALEANGVTPTSEPR